MGSGREERVGSRLTDLRTSDGFDEGGHGGVDGGDLEEAHAVLDAALAFACQ